MFFSTVPLFTIVDKTFLPYDDEGQFAITVRAPEGASVDTTQTIARVDRRRARASSKGVDEHGRHHRRRSAADAEPRHGLREARRRVESASDQYEIMDRVRKEILPQYQRLNLRTQVAPVNEFGGGTDAEVMFWIGGPDLDAARQVRAPADRRASRIRSSARPTSTRTSSSASRSWPCASTATRPTDLGVRVQDLAATLNVLVGGQQATSYYEGGEEYEVHVRAEESVAQQRRRHLADRSAVGDRREREARATSCTLQEGTGPSVINRFNRRRMVMVLANMQPGYSSQTVMDAARAEGRRS